VVVGVLPSTPVVMPQMGLEVTEGVVAAIHVAVGASVAEGEILVELETDKALTEVIAPRAGVVASIDVEIGDTVELGATLIVLAGDGDGEAATVAAPTESAAPASPTPPGQSRLRDGRPRSAPVARRAAERLGVSLAQVTGTGPRGRITLRDVESAAAARPANGGAPAPTAAEGLEPLSGLRRAVARRMTESQGIPQFVLNREIDATWLLAEKARLSQDAKVSVNDMLVQALAETVMRHAGLGASFVESDDDEPPRLMRRSGADVGLAVATERGLLVPVLRRAHEHSLRELAADRTRLVDAARAGRLSLEEMSGATISISNLGGFGVDSFTAMLNPGESAILAVGRPLERVVPRDRGFAVITTVALSLTIDHRVLDGASGAEALVELAGLLEGGMTWRP
jgi:pyruvate dehydrogenase E2 component (dihydrolipoamide acetyltransferase)